MKSEFAEKAHELVLAHFKKICPETSEGRKTVRRAYSLFKHILYGGKHDNSEEAVKMVILQGIVSLHEAGMLSPEQDYVKNGTPNPLHNFDKK